MRQGKHSTRLPGGLKAVLRESMLHMFIKRSSHLSDGDIVTTCSICCTAYHFALNWMRPMQESDCWNGTSDSPSAGYSEPT